MQIILSVKTTVANSDGFPQPIVVAKLTWDDVQRERFERFAYLAKSLQYQAAHDFDKPLAIPYLPFGVEDQFFLYLYEEAFSDMKLHAVVAHNVSYQAIDDNYLLETYVISDVRPDWQNILVEPARRLDDVIFSMQFGKGQLSGTTGKFRLTDFK